MKFEAIAKSEFLGIKRTHKQGSKQKEMERMLFILSNSLDVDVVEFKDWKRSYRTKDSCVAALRTKIKDLGIDNLSVSVREERIFIVKG